MTYSAPGQFDSRAFRQLRAEVPRERRVGKMFIAHAHVASHRADAEAADLIVRQAGLFPTDRWRHEVDVEAARKHLAHLLHQDLAYHSPLMPPTRAEFLASQLIGLCAWRICYTNTETPLSLGHTSLEFTWTPITPATFDSGVVCIGDRHSVIFWCCDED